jgi:hypothetical protein
VENLTADGVIVQMHMGGRRLAQPQGSDSQQADEKNVGASQAHKGQADKCNKQPVSVMTSSCLWKGGGEGSIMGRPDNGTHVGDADGGTESNSQTRYAGDPD